MEDIQGKDIDKSVKTTVDVNMCTGCTACMSVCPEECIIMKSDEEGFKHPKVSKSDCSNCGMCSRACPVLEKQKQNEVLRVAAAKNKDDAVRLSSSSGGVFTLLAEQVIKSGGVVFGAAINKRMQVVHTYTESIDGLKQFRGSKYVQSDMGECFTQAEEFLKLGRRVLFSGTPCQIGGLIGFLRKPYDNLLTVDCICMGVPTPKVWELYSNARVEDANAPATEISFRSKQTGWSNYSFSMTFNNGTLYSKTHKEDAYMRCFGKLVFIRPSCHQCVFKNLTNKSDITLGDYWGVATRFKTFDDNRGISLVLLNSQKGADRFSEIEDRLIVMESDVKHAMDTHRSLVESIPPSKKRDAFFKMLESDKMDIDTLLNKYSRHTPAEFFRRCASFVLRKTGLSR